MAALVLKNQALVISADESKKLAQALKNLAAQYNVTPNPAVMAWMQLAAVSAAIYGPRIFMIVQQRKVIEAQRKREQASPIPQSPVTMAAHKESAKTGQGSNGAGTIRWN